VTVKSPDRGDEARLSSFLGWLDRYFGEHLSSINILSRARLFLLVAPWSVEMSWSRRSTRCGGESDIPLEARMPAGHKELTREMPSVVPAGCMDGLLK